MEVVSIERPTRSIGVPGNVAPANQEHETSGFHTRTRLACLAGLFPVDDQDDTRAEGFTQLHGGELSYWLASYCFGGLMDGIGGAGLVGGGRFAPLSPWLGGLGRGVGGGVGLFVAIFSLSKVIR